jgi:hypothetical protein
MPVPESHVFDMFTKNFKNKLKSIQEKKISYYCYSLELILFLFSKFSH